MLVVDISLDVHIAKKLLQPRWQAFKAETSNEGGKEEGCKSSRSFSWRNFASELVWHVDQKVDHSWNL